MDSLKRILVSTVVIATQLDISLLGNIKLGVQLFCKMISIISYHISSYFAIFHHI